MRRNTLALFKLERIKIMEQDLFGTASNDISLDTFIRNKGAKMLFIIETWIIRCIKGGYCKKIRGFSKCKGCVRTRPGFIYLGMIDCVPECTGDEMKVKNARLFSYDPEDLINPKCFTLLSSESGCQIGFKSNGDFEFGKSSPNLEISQIETFIYI